MRSPSVASRSRTRGWRTATGPMPVMISRSGRWPWRTTRCWPVAVFRSACFARNSATSASMAWVSSARAPLRRISVRESLKVPGWASLITLLSDMAYHSFIGEVGALNTHHDTPPYPVMPSPTSGHSSEWHGPERYEQDMARQRDLERAGWRFVRIRGGDYYRDSEKSTASLWAELD